MRGALLSSPHPRGRARTLGATRAAAERPAPALRERSGLALGVGEPTSATAGWFRGPLISGALGAGTFAGVGLSIHADAQYIVHRLAPGAPVHRPRRPPATATTRCRPTRSFDSHYGVRASLETSRSGEALRPAELAGIDVVAAQAARRERRRHALPTPRSHRSSCSSPSVLAVLLPLIGVPCPSFACCLTLVAACAGDPSIIYIELSPSVISSLDGTTTVTALISDVEPLLGPERISTAYRDRNGTPHEVAPVEGTTDARGVIERPSRASWDGVGTVTVEASAAESVATFSVLDRTPPRIEILPPTTDGRPDPAAARRAGASDRRDRRQRGHARYQRPDPGERALHRACSGAPDTTLTFRMSIPTNAQPGPTIELQALASDLATTPRRRRR